MKTAVAEFFATHLGFVPLKSVHQQKGKVDLQSDTIAWDTYGQALFIGADSYADYLFPADHSGGKNHHKTMSLYLGLGLVEAVTHLDVARDRAQNSYAFEKKRVEANAYGVAEHVAQLETNLQLVSDRIAAFDAGQSILIDASHLTAVREKIAASMQRVADLIDQEQRNMDNAQHLRTERDKEQRICRELRETIQFKFYLSGLAVEQCPNCEQAIPEGRMEEERETKQCRVCHSPLRPIATTDLHEHLLKKAEEQLAIIKRTLKDVEKELLTIKKEREAAEQEAQRYRNELHDLPRQEQAGFTAELRTLLAQQGYLQGELAQVRTRSIDNQASVLEDIQSKSLIFEAAHNRLREEVTRQHRELITQLEEQTTALSHAFGVPNLEGITFNSNFSMFISQAGKKVRYADMDPSELLRLKIAFHLALLSLRVRHGIGRHPGFLVVDAPGGAEMDDKHVGAIFDGFADVKRMLGDHCQILIASTKDELSFLCESDKIELRQGEDPIF